MTTYLRRGKVTDAVFAAAKRITRVHPAGIERNQKDTEPREVPIGDAYAVFQERKRLKMSRRSDGVYVFIDSYPWGYVRYELHV